MDAIMYAIAELDILKNMVAEVDTNQTEALEKEISVAKRIFIGGAGRSLLSMKGFAMRLMQTNHETYLVGEVCTPSVQPGDLLIIGSGSGNTQVTLEMVRKAKKHGARTALITLNPNGRIVSEVDCVLLIPRKEIENPENDTEYFIRTHLPGNISEASITLVLDGLIASLMNNNDYTKETIMFNHANLE